MAIIKVITPSVTDANITTAKVTDNAITLAKMASGTDGNIISYDASGNPVAIATGSDGQVLTSTGAGSPPAFETPASGDNTPAFSAYASATQNGLTSGSFVKIVFGTELLDTDNTFATNRFTVPTGGAGTYHFSSNLVLQATNGASELRQANGAFYKNGSIYAATGRFDGRNAGYSRETALNGSLTVTLAEDDYIEVYGLVVTANGTGEVNYGDKGARFSGYKILT
jgi:hypothetical protein